MAFCFRFAKEQIHAFSYFVSVDVRFAYFSLGACHVFSMTEVHSSFNMIPMGYVLIVGNKSGDTWRRTVMFYRKYFSFDGRLTTVISNGENVISIGFENAVSATDMPCLVACA